MTVTLPRVARVVNLVGFIAFGATGFLVSVPAAWRLVGLLCLLDALFIRFHGSTAVFGNEGGKHLRGTWAYAFAAFAAVLGLVLLVFGQDIYCSLASGKPACS